MKLKDSPKQRREFLSIELAQRGIDVAIISDPHHVFYLTGLVTHTPRLAAFLILFRNESFLLLGESAAAGVHSMFDGAVFTFEDYKIQKRMVAYADFVADELEKVLISEIGKGVQRVGVEHWHLPQVYLSAISAAFPGIRLTGISDVLISFRKTKGKDEISYLKDAAGKIDFAYQIAKSLAKVGNSEMDLYTEVNKEIFAKYGPFKFGEIPNVTGDYVSGERTLEVGGPPTSRKFQLGDTIILDLQTNFNNYWADTARTFVVEKQNEKQQHVFNILLKAKLNAEALLRPGTKGKEIYQAIFKEISNAGYSSVFPHHAGHGLGLESQEPPFFLPFSEEALEEGVVCAVEPGIYEPSAGGIRIEDNYVITKHGFEKISTFPLEMC